MLFLSLLPSISTVTRQDTSLLGMFGSGCDFFQHNNKLAYSFAINRIKACNSQYVKDCPTERNNFPKEPEPNSRGNHRKIASLK